MLASKMSTYMLSLHLFFASMARALEMSAGFVRGFQKFRKVMEMDSAGPGKFWKRVAFQNGYENFGFLFLRILKSTKMDKV